jgi:hypothetical protein
VSELYDLIGADYWNYRRPDPRIARAIDAALAVLTIHHWPDRGRGAGGLP